MDVAQTRRAETDTRVRTAEQLAYFLGLVAAIMYAGSVAAGVGWRAESGWIAIAVLSVALGWALGRRRVAWAAIGMIVVVIAGLTLPLTVTAKGRYAIATVLLIWKFAQAFQALRETGRERGEPGVRSGGRW